MGEGRGGWKDDGGTKGTVRGTSTDGADTGSRVFSTFRRCTSTRCRSSEPGRSTGTTGRGRTDRGSTGSNTTGTSTRGRVTCPWFTSPRVGDVECPKFVGGGVQPLGEDGSIRGAGGSTGGKTLDPTNTVGNS